MGYTHVASITYITQKKNKEYLFFKSQDWELFDHS